MKRLSTLMNDAAIRSVDQQMKEALINGNVYSLDKLRKTRNDYVNEAQKLMCRPSIQAALNEVSK